MPYLLLALLLIAIGALLIACRRAQVADWGRGWLNLIDGLNRLFCRYWHRLPPTRLPLPESGPVVLAANHHSGLDPLLLIAASPRPLRFLIAREEYRRFGLNWLFRAVGCIPVDRGGRPERALRAALEALQRGEVVALFPHGGIHLDDAPPRPLKRGVAWLAERSAAPLLPVRIAGIAGLGRVLPAVFLRSRARLTAGTVLQCREGETETCLHALAEWIEAVRAGEGVQESAVHGSKVDG